MRDTLGDLFGLVFWALVYAIYFWPVWVIPAIAVAAFYLGTMIGGR